MTACNFAWFCMATCPESQYNYIFLIEIAFKIAIQIAEIIFICVSFDIFLLKKTFYQNVYDNRFVSDPVSDSFFTNLEIQIQLAN
ncbi:unnamed protein product [Paramecium sonneborni]|uniref:Uncharacterized protein n=1 Tax=Paramecium sonneborni TaxID=65129 RepID=A0A8S1L740_9CILI|nr:unnamed protein product [Paramecium sonneborni]